MKIKFEFKKGENVFKAVQVNDINYCTKNIAPGALTPTVQIERVYVIESNKEFEQNLVDVYEELNDTFLNNKEDFDFIDVSMGSFKYTKMIDSTDLALIRYENIMREESITETIMTERILFVNFSDK